MKSKLSENRVIAERKRKATCPKQKKAIGGRFVRACWFFFPGLWSCGVEDV